MVVGCSSMRQLCSGLLMGTAMAVVFASCTSTDNMAPVTTGGPGPIVSLNNDAGHADGARDVAIQASSTGGHGGMALGTGGTTLGSGGNGAGSGGNAGSQGAAGAGGTGGAAGSGTPDDPCTACEKSRCSNTNLSMDIPSTGYIPYATLAGAYEVCFTGTGWPSATADPSVACTTDPSDTGATAANGPAAGTAKTTLCQALLKCVHQTNCPGADDDELQCYCGSGVALGTCESPGFVPSGVCDSQVAAALESTDFSSSDHFIGDVCLAYGAAFTIFDSCDANCCETECGLTPSGSEDPTFCNATSTGGASGTGGTTATGGTTGTGGVHGTGGTTGTGGTIGTGGLPASGGTTGAGGGGGPAGVSGAAGSGQGGAIGSTGGSSGTGG